MSSQKSAKNQYSQEFKIQVLEVLENSPKSMAQVAKEFGIAYPTSADGNLKINNFHQSMVTTAMKILLRRLFLLL